MKILLRFLEVKFQQDISKESKCDNSSSKAIK